MSFPQADIVTMNNADYQNQMKFYGDKLGKGRAVFDVAALGGLATPGNYPLGLVIPKGSQLTSVVYKVLVSAASSGSATIGLSVVSAGDVLAPAAYSGFTAGVIPVATLVLAGTLSSQFFVGADSTLTLNLATANLSAGKIVIWASWLYHGDV